jgi:hypothetical protein
MSYRSHPPNADIFTDRQRHSIRRRLAVRRSRGNAGWSDEALPDGVQTVTIGVGEVAERREQRPVRTSVPQSAFRNPGSPTIRLQLRGPGDNLGRQPFRFCHLREQFGANRFDIW